LSVIGTKKKNPKTMSEQKTLPILAQNARRGQGKAALQHKKNIVRAKKWVDEHEV